VSCGCAEQDLNTLLDDLIYTETGVIILDQAAKSIADPTTLRGFLLHEGLLVKQLLTNSIPAKAALKAELNDLFSPESIAIHGSPASPYYQERVAEAWRNYSDSTVPHASRLIRDAQLDIGERTMMSWARQYDSKTRPATVDAGFKTEVSFSWEPEKTRWTEKDQYAMEFLGANNAIYMGKHFNERQVTMAKNIIARDQSLYADNPEKAGQRIKEGLVSMADVTDAYWKTVSTNALNNARSYAGLRYCAKRGIVAYRIRAVIDSRTTPICQSLNGRVFPVQQGLEVFEKMNSASSVEQLDLASPMVRTERINGKPTGRYIVGKDEKRWVFDSLDDLQPWSGLDADDEVKPLKTSTEALTASGVMFPPFHFNCRSGLEPVVGTATTEAPEPEKPPSDPPPSIQENIGKEAVQQTPETQKERPTSGLSRTWDNPSPENQELKNKVMIYSRSEKTHERHEAAIAQRYFDVLVDIDKTAKSVPGKYPKAQVDIVLRNALIEASEGQGGKKARQVERYKNPNANPDMLPVIVFLDFPGQIPFNRIRAIEEKGAIVVRSLEELDILVEKYHAPNNSSQ